MDGIITWIGHVYDDDSHYTYVQISNGDWVARELYVNPGPGIAIGMRVSAGDFIGHQQPLHEKYGGITEHVEVQLRYRGTLVNPGPLIPVSAVP